jgi:Rne/Rng family ribonuclease
MQKEMVISTNPHETRVAILEEGQLCEYYVEREKEFALVGSIYKGRVTRVLPGMQSAFVEIGLDSDAFLYVTDFLEGIEEFEPIVGTVESKAQKIEEQGGGLYPPGGSPGPAIEPNDVDSAPIPSPDMPGQVFGETAEPAPAATLPAPAAPVYNTAPNRPHYENRGRGGRDFGRRGGRGRFRRGGRGGDRRYGRELPPSKYASPRSPEERGESGPLGHVDVILPGESLAKFRERPAAPPSADANSPAPHAEGLLAPDTRGIAPEPHSEPVAEPAAPQTSRSGSAHAEPPRDPRPFRHAYGGIEPLPGESLAKWRQKEPAAEILEPAAPAAHEEHEFTEAHEPGVQEIAEPETSAEAETEELAEHAEDLAADLAPELSDEEIAAAAEHVVEAQSELAERKASQRAAEAEEAALSGAEGSAEEVELEEEEEAAESEGMIAPESESESEDESESETAEEAGLEEEEEAAESEGMIAPSVDSEREPEGEAIAAEAGLHAAAGAEGKAVAEQQPWRAQVRTDFRARMQHPGQRGRRDDRGRRSHGGHHHHHRQQQRRPQLIADLLKQGQEIIVQIAKEPLGKKGARITSHVALPGRYLVYMPTLDHSGVSRKIASAEDRSRLRHVVKEAQGGAGGGFIVRTAAASASPEEIRADVEFLTRTWTEIKTRAEQRKAPALLHRDLNLVERILRDYLTPDFGSIWVDSEESFAKVVEFMSRFQPELVTRVKLYTKETPVFEEFGIQQEIDKGLRPKVWLKSGGYIVINHTEALVAIDVNTGKFVGKGSTRLEDTIVRTNLEAVKEIVRQMRLRDLGGIIVIDFIDMEDRRNREKVMAALEDALRADRAPSKMLRFNEFGLIAITRKRTKQALERTLCQPCPYCTGSGMVKSVPTLCYEIQTEARKMAPEMDAASITLRVHPEIAKALKTREAALVEELERWTRKTVIIQSDPTLHWEQYDIY